MSESSSVLMLEGDVYSVEEEVVVVIRECSLRVGLLSLLTGWGKERVGLRWAKKGEETTGTYY